MKRPPVLRLVAQPLVALLLAGLLGACGGAAPRPDPLLDDDPMLPGEREALQMYLVLTSDPGAMQGEGAVDGMWEAVHGKRERYAPIHARLQGVPGGYELDVELDFADLPHPMLPAEALAGLIADLPPDARAKAEAATFAVSVRSAAPPIPGGGQIRLVGTAALYAADAHDGVILDLLARRAWTREGWAAELAGPVLSAGQVRLLQRIGPDGGVTLLTRGNPKYGAPDLQMRGIDRAALSAARARFLAAQAALIEDGGAPGRSLTVQGEAVRLAPCEGVAIEVGCVRIDAP